MSGRLAYRVKEAAQLLGVSTVTMYTLIHKHGVPVVRIGKSMRIPAEGLRQWLEKGTRSGHSTALQFITRRSA